MARIHCKPSADAVYRAAFFDRIILRTVTTSIFPLALSLSKGLCASTSSARTDCVDCGVSWYNRMGGTKSGAVRAASSAPTFIYPANPVNVWFRLVWLRLNEGNGIVTRCQCRHGGHAMPFEYPPKTPKISYNSTQPRSAATDSFRQARFPEEFPKELRSPVFNPCRTRDAR